MGASIRRSSIGLQANDSSDRKQRMIIDGPFANGPGKSHLSEHQVDHPAAADVVGGLAAVGEDVGVGAAGFFEGVGEDGERAPSRGKSRKTVGRLE